MFEPWMLVPINLALIAVLILAKGVKKKHRTANPWGKVPYAANEYFLSEAERKFYFALLEKVQDKAIICPKTAVRELLYVTNEAGKDSQMYFNWISQKHVDFVLCNAKTIKAICAVELDDSSHQRKDRIQRDQFMDKAFEQAKIPLFHVKCKARYSDEDFSDICDLVGINYKKIIAEKKATPKGPPLCPKCGAKMVLRTVKNGENAGEIFYGCKNYPECTGTISYYQ